MELLHEDVYIKIHMYINKGIYIYLKATNFSRYKL